jgi:predicted permease
MRLRLRQIWLRLKALAQRKQLDRDLEDEVAFHLAMREEKNRQCGVVGDEAKYAARREFGNVTLTKDRSREMWIFAGAEKTWRDLRYGVRSLRKSPGFSVVALLTLALGIGAPTAIFSVIDSVMLQPLPFAAPDELVRILATKDGTSTDSGPSAPDLRDYARSNHTFQEMVVYDAWRKNVSLGSTSPEPEQIVVGLVSAKYFELLRISPLMGRLFSEKEDQSGPHNVVAISSRLWQRRFGGDKSVLGRTIRINDEPYTIVAVMPDKIPDWMEWRTPEVWTPFAILDDVWSETSRGARGFSALGRLKPGVSLEQAQADVAAIAARLAEAHPIDRGVGVLVKPLADTRVGTMRPILFLLMGAVSLILLIACSNLANLLLARNSVQQRELAMRAALGAGRVGLVRQLLAETLLLSLMGGAAGLLLARAGLAVLARIGVNEFPQLAMIQIHSRVLLFTLVTSLGTSVLFGLAPALTGTRLNLNDALKQGGRSGMGPSRQRLRNALVATEMALSLMLLVGASLLIQSIYRLERQDLGVRQDHLLKGHFYVPGARYPDTGAITRFCDEFARRARGAPGVLDASVTTVYPPSGRWKQLFSIAGRPMPRMDDMPTTRFGLADSHLLRTLGIPLLRGRDFSDTDTATSPNVALISEEFRRRYFAEEDPIGKQVHIGPPAGTPDTAPGSNTWDFADVTLIGVIGNIKTDGLAAPAQPLIIGLYSQHPAVNYGFKDIVIRTATEPHFVAQEIANRLHGLDPDMPFAEVQTMDEMIAAETGGQRFTTTLLTLFTVAGLALAVVGIYGVVSYLVTQRSQELAVRVALGASRANVLSLVMQRGLKMASVGAAIGLFGAWATRQFTSELLFGVSPVDPLTFIGAAVFLLLVAAMASAIPGMRVMRINPARALRQE